MYNQPPSRNDDAVVRENPGNRGHYCQMNIEPGRPLRKIDSFRRHIEFPEVTVVEHPHDQPRFQEDEEQSP
jgi:hypothetical protein